MAPSRPKLKTERPPEFYLSRFAEGEWREVVRPWLEASRGSLRRSLVVVPTRGQAQALKQRCLEEGLALLGVEFLTPGLARKKREAPEALPRSLQLLALRDLIERRVSSLAPEDPALGLWQSLASDLETALDDFEDLLRAGFGAGDFPRPELRELFGDLVTRTRGWGYALAPLEDLAEAQAPFDPARPPIADRLLILGGGPENWPHFFGLCALCGRAREVTVALAEPNFNADDRAAEQWAEAWQGALGVPYEVVGADPPATADAVGALWRGGAGSAERAEVWIGPSRADEMEQLRDAITARLAAGATSIAVVFPRATSAHARLVALLDAQHVPYADLIGSAGTPPLDARAQRALVEFYERGGRLEDLLGLWPFLVALNSTRTTPGEARRACQRLFDRSQSHLIAPHLGRFASDPDPHVQEVGRMVGLLLPLWPDRLTAAEAVERFERARDALSASPLAEPPGWGALREFARRAAEPMPARALLAAIRTFLPAKGPAAASSARSVFARVTLTTLRRAVGVVWSDCLLAEANAGVWPEPREPSVWLDDAVRRQRVQAVGRLDLSLPTSEDAAALERRMYAALARDTRERVGFTAALFHEEDPETRLGPNVWLERVLWSQGLLPDPVYGLPAFETLAERHVAAARGPEHPSIGAWAAVWRGRRDPARPFDAFFFSDPSGQTRPRRLSASQIQAAVRDPASLWFDAVLGVRRVEWRPFARSLGKAAGEAVHRLMARTLRGAPAEGPFTQTPEPAAAAAALEAELAQLRAEWPADRFWESFHLGIARSTRILLRRVYELPPAAFGAVEAKLHPAATVPLGSDRRLSVYGRMDLVRSNRPHLAGAEVQIVDFKTGRDDAISPERMAGKGDALQLGIYLEAARSEGAVRGDVWMLRPERPASSLGMEELGRALAKLAVIGSHLDRGIYGALTPDRTPYAHALEWPLACAPVPAAILKAKFALTFGTGADEEDGEDD